MMPMAASVSISLMLPGSMKIFIRPLFVLNRIRELADALNGDRDRIARDERADPFRRAGRDDVPRLERHHERDVFDDVLDREDELRRARSLTPLTVDPTLHVEGA